MAHYAFLDENNIVTRVIVGRDEDDLPEGVTDWETYYGENGGQTCKRTSYNTIGNAHMFGGEPFRGNFAGIGSVYDPSNDVFHAPQPFPSWTLNTTTWLWEAPTPYPERTPVEGGEDGEVNDPGYDWDEETLSWVLAEL